MPSKKHPVLVGNQSTVQKHQKHVGNTVPTKQGDTASVPSPKKSAATNKSKTDEPHMTGTITYVDIKKGYGYIKDDDGTSYYISQKTLEYAHQPDWEISKGDKVSFTDYTSKKGTHYVIT